MSIRPHHRAAACAACIALCVSNGGIPASAMGSAEPLSRARQAPALPAAPQAPRALPSLSGTIHTPDRKRLLSAAIIMIPLEDESVARPSEDVRILPDGSFVFRNVPPGRYQIRARGETEPEGVSHFATYTVIVDDRDMREIDMVLMPGADIHGTLVHAVKTQKPDSWAGVRVRLPLKDGSSFGDTVTGDVRRDGGFRIRGALAGSHAVTVEGLPAPWVIERVTLRGEDITDAGLDVQGGQRVTDLRVIVTPVATEVVGSVRDSSGAPAAGALVVIAPLTPQPWPRTSRHVAVAQTDSNGRFSVRGLPTGEYRAVASHDLPLPDAYRQDVLQAALRAGRPLAVDPGRRSELDLVVTAASTLRRAPMR